MKTVFVNRFFYPDHSATSQILSDLAFRLAEGGRPVWVVTGRQTYGDPRARLPRREQVRGVRVIRVWSTRYGRSGLAGRALDALTFSCACFTALLGVLRKGDVAIAKTDPPLVSVFVMAAAFLRGARLANWVQDLFPEAAVALGVKGLAGPVRGALEALRNLALRRAAFNVVIGQGMRDRVAAAVPGVGRIEVIHNWSDGRVVRPVPHDLNPLRKEWGLDRHFVVGYSGNLGRAHEFETVVEAAALLEDPSICFLWIGSGKRMDELRERLARSGLSERFHFKPYQPFDRLSLSLSAADVHLVTLKSALEGLVVPSKFYGILAAGRPIAYVGDPDSELAEILSTGRCGQAVRPGAARELAERLSEWAASPELCRAMGRRARELYEARFDENRALEKWKRLLGGE